MNFKLSEITFFKSHCERFKTPPSLFDNVVPRAMICEHESCDDRRGFCSIIHIIAENEVFQRTLPFNTWINNNGKLYRVRYIASKVFIVFCKYIWRLGSKELQFTYLYIIFWMYNDSIDAVVTYCSSCCWGRGGSRYTSETSEKTQWASDRLATTVCNPTLCVVDPCCTRLNIPKEETYMQDGELYIRDFLDEQAPSMSATERENGISCPELRRHRLVCTLLC